MSAPLRFLHIALKKYGARPLDRGVSARNILRYATYLAIDALGRNSAEEEFVRSLVGYAAVRITPLQDLAEQFTFNLTDRDSLVRRFEAWHETTQFPIEEMVDLGRGYRVLEDYERDYWEAVAAYWAAREGDA